MGSFASRILNVGNPSGDIREGIERSPGHGNTVTLDSLHRTSGILSINMLSNLHFKRRGDMDKVIVIHLWANYSIYEVIAKGQSVDESIDKSVHILSGEGNSCNVLGVAMVFNEPECPTVGVVWNSDMIATAREEFTKERGVRFGSSSSIGSRNLFENVPRPVSVPMRSKGVVSRVPPVKSLRALTQLFSKMVEESATNAIVKGTIEVVLGSDLSNGFEKKLGEIHHYLFPRDHNEKLKRFNQFKEMAKRVYNRNKTDGPFTLRLNNVADRTIEELCGAVVESGPRVSYYGNGGQMKS
ncbi:hypothetical protein HHK36_018305 [Tetracentron sinense]|uniref:Cathepsin propeptide inhibitor domain-containing protein n=1 Tax=Tetracentron sinense TaxID=13715 RepID=A0A834YYA5_TETSI|nr:hypothetical protein HHK36_018305 [Tetracentron sinense]